MKKGMGHWRAWNRYYVGTVLGYCAGKELDFGWFCAIFVLGIIIMLVSDRKRGFERDEI